MENSFSPDPGSPPDIIARIAEAEDIATSLGTTRNGSQNLIGEWATALAHQASEELLNAEGRTALDAQAFLAAAKSHLMNAVCTLIGASSRADEDIAIAHFDHCFKLTSKALETLSGLTGISEEALRITNPTKPH